MLDQESLFRREVFIAKRQSVLGSIHLATPLTHWLIASFVALFAFSLVAFLYFGHYIRGVCHQSDVNCGKVNKLPRSKLTGYWCHPPKIVPIDGHYGVFCKCHLVPSHNSLSSLHHHAFRLC